MLSVKYGVRGAKVSVVGLSHSYVSKKVLKASVDVKNKSSCFESVPRRGLSTKVDEFSNIKTLNEVIERSIKNYGTKNCLGTFVTTPTKKFDWVNYQEFGQLISTFRKVLVKHHIDKNTKVAMISNNRLEWAVATYAVMSIGGQIVPMYEAQLEKDWKFIIENSGAKMILVANDKIYDKVKGYVGTVGQVHSVLSFDASEDYLHSYKKWMNMASKEADIPPAHISENDVAVLIYTSGTTGKPKGVKLSHRNFVEDFKGVKAIWKESLEGLEALAVLPWAHVFGQVADLHTMLATGSSIAILPSREQLIECLPIARPTLISAVPVLLNRVHDGIRKKVASQSPLRQKIFHWALSAARKRNHLLEFHQPVDFFTDLQFRLADRIVLKKIREAFGGRLRFMASGGAAAMLPVVQFFEDIGIPILEGYGLTETSPIITCGSLSWENRRLGCIGVPLPNIDVKILDPATLTFIPSAEEGEIVVSGPIVMVGYHDNPEADKAVFMDIDGKRYFRTGDLGRFIEGKFLKVTGRLKEQYKLENGKYVVPAPLEDDIARSHFIAQALIYGDNRPYNVALIVLDLVELKDWCAKNSISGADDMSKLAKHEKIIDLIAHELSQVSGVMKTYERPHRFAILDEAFTQENQFLTPKMSLRRVNILAKYASTVKALYEKTAGHDVPRSGVMSEKDQTP